MLRSFYTPRPVLASLLVRLFRAGRSFVPTWSRRPLIMAGLLLLPVLVSAQSTGIGTTAPDAAAALDIVSSDKGLLLPRVTATARGLIGSPGAPPTGLLVYQTDGAQPGFWYYEATAGWTHLDPTGADNLGNHAATQNIGLNGHWLSNDGSATGLRLDNAGNAGLGGATYSGFRLSVEQPGYSTMLLRDSRPLGNQVGPHQFFMVGPAGGAEYAGAIIDYIHTDAGLPHRDKALEIRAGGSANNGRINFHTGPGASLSKPQMTIRADGSVGINLAAAATPFKSLHVEGGVHASGPVGELSFADRTVAGNRFVWYARDDVARLFAGDLGPAGAGTDLIGVTHTGLTGFGTVSPRQKVHVYSTTQYGGIRIHVAPAPNTFGSGSLEFWSDPQGNPFEWRPGMIRSVDQGGFTGGLAFYVNGTGSTHRTDSLEVMRITNRRVGIGTPTPLAALHVSDTVSTNTMTAYFEGNNSTYAGAYVNARKATAMPFWGYQRQGVLVGWHEMARNGDWHLLLPFSAGTQFIPLTVTDTLGYVGLNATTPRTRLTLTPTVLEPKITLWDGGSTTSHNGFGVSGTQLNYHVATANDSHVFYAGGKNGDGAELMRVRGSGLVGIGTPAPAHPLHVVAPDATYSTVAQFEGSGVGFAGVYTNATSAGAVPFYGYKQQGTTKAYHQLNAFGDWQLIVNSGIRLTVDGPTGSLGVGTVNPIARLHVNGGVSTAPTGATYSYFSPGSGALATSTTATARNIAAYFEGGQVWVNSAIVAGALNTSSDRRIKQVVGRSDGAQDLRLLNDLRITDYRYIDQVNNPATVVKKVIAQEVEAVLPAAVSRSRMAIPDVYEVAAAVRWAPATGTVTVRTTKAHGFRAGDQVRLYTPQQQDHNPYVFVLDEHTFSYIATEAPADHLFVYGKFVDDFRAVDYDALAMLNVSATQELARQLAALQQQNTALHQQVEASTQGFEQRLRELETRLGAARK